MEILFGIVIVFVAIAFIASIFSATDSIYKNISGQTNVHISKNNQEMCTIWNCFNATVNIINNAENEEMKERFLDNLENIIFKLESNNQDVAEAWKIYNSLNV